MGANNPSERFFMQVPKDFKHTEFGRTAFYAVYSRKTAAGGKIKDYIQKYQSSFVKDEKSSARFMTLGIVSFICVAGALLRVRCIKRVPMLQLTDKRGES